MVNLTKCIILSKNAMTKLWISFYIAKLKKKRWMDGWMDR